MANLNVQICIIGSGPAGLSAATHAAELGVPHVLLEAEAQASNTIQKYQKGKHVMATPSSLVLRSDLGFDAGKREMVLGTWSRKDRLYGGEWRAMVEAKFGGPPTIDFLNSPVVIDNRQGTVTAP